MESFCKYCFHEFDRAARIPFKLECEHVLCKECIKYLDGRVEYCPLDRKAVNYSDAKESKSCSEYLKSLCKIHKKPIISLCKIDVCLLCSDCDPCHEKNYMIYGDIYKIEKELNLALKKLLKFDFSSMEEFLISDFTFIIDYLINYKKNIWGEIEQTCSEVGLDNCRVFIENKNKSLDRLFKRLED